MVGLSECREQFSKFVDHRAAIGCCTGSIATRTLRVRCNEAVLVRVG